MSEVRRVWERFWYARIDAEPMLWFRQAFAWVMLIYFGYWARHAPEWLTHQGFHPSPAVDAYNAPQVPLLEPSLLPFVGTLFFGCLVAYILGFARKWVVWPVLAGAIYVILADPISAFTINRLFAIGFVLLALMPEPEPDPNQPGRFVQVAWPTRMFQVLLIVHYTVAGICKITQGDWLTEDDVLWTQVQGLYMTDAAAFLVRVLPHWAWDVQQWAALGFELFAPLLFIPRRVRPFGIAIGVVMHVIIAVTMDKLSFFSAQMVCYYLLFVPPAFYVALRSRLAPQKVEGDPAAPDQGETKMRA